MLCHTPKYNLKNQISIDRPLKLQTKNLVFVTSPDQHFCRGVRNWSIDILMRVMVENERDSTLSVYIIIKQVSKMIIFTHKNILYKNPKTLTLARFKCMSGKNFAITYTKTNSK